MEYVQRAVHKEGYLMHDRVHLADDEAGETLCGKKLNHMWFVTGSTDKLKKKVTCPKCKSLSGC